MKKFIMSNENNQKYSDPQYDQTRKGGDFSGSSNNNYVDLNQFLKQHFHKSDNHNNNQQKLIMNQHHNNNRNNNNLRNTASSSSWQEHQHMPSSNSSYNLQGDNSSSDIIRSSNLIPTAAEFIPRFNYLNITDHNHDEQYFYQQQQPQINHTNYMYNNNGRYISTEPFYDFAEQQQQRQHIMQHNNATTSNTHNNIERTFPNLDAPSFQEYHNHNDRNNLSTNYMNHNSLLCSYNSNDIVNVASNINLNIRRNLNNRNNNHDTNEASTSQRNQQKHENNRHNKRRDNWNRNRDRELLSSDSNKPFHNNNNSGSGSSSDNSRRHEHNYQYQQNQQNPSKQYQYKENPPKKESNNNTLHKSPHKEIIITNVYSCSNHYNKQQIENEKLPQREKLIKEIECRKLECPVCVETIKAHQSVWSCSSCYHIFHLSCVVKWANSSKSENGWRCPACQNITQSIPHDYYCFCGKLRNPDNNRTDLPHSCGDVCGRKDHCLHPCTLLCHPGPCPACQALVTRECGCGKTTKAMQCYLKQDIECELICGKLLTCELNTCTQKCHTGKCPPCDKKIDQVCHCGKQERQVMCTRDSNEKKNYSCGKVCNKSLACGNHKCKDCCHTGNCKPCKLGEDFITTCPCGQLEIKKGERKLCLDPIPVCSNICGKTLKCGPTAFSHHCMNKCHTGNCPPCNKQTAVKCRCGHMDQMIKCRQLSTRADDARCKKRCTKKRSCGKHKCNQECCIDIDHICPMPCNYTLSCGKHKCDQPCHRGNCSPCYRSSFDELYCECGANVIFPPVPCGTKRPTCDQPCTRTHSCDHPVQHSCHSAINCPPCIILTTKWCYGKHEQRKTIPCNQDSFSCGLPCNKNLSCGRHKCMKTCHENSCQQPGETCKQNCLAIRTNCKHKCNAPCHANECPDTPCKESVEVTCECGHRKQMRLCHDLTRDYRRIATAALASSMNEMQSGGGGMLELSDIMAPPKLTSNKILECTEECRVIERNRKLAIGLQIRNPDTAQKLLTRYSEFIRGWAKKDLHLVKTIHNTLTDLVKLSKESKQKSRSHSFPTMNREKRQLVHEMCGMFGVESEAYDAEPNRNVVATASKGKAWLPAMSIMDVLQRESGQRRVPVPNNNAWGIKK